MYSTSCSETYALLVAAPPVNEGPLDTLPPQQRRRRNVEVDRAMALKRHFSHLVVIVARVAVISGIAMLVVTLRRNQPTEELTLMAMAT